MRYELTDFEWAAIRSFLPNKPRGIPRVDDRSVLNGIFWVLRSGARWRDLREKTNLLNRINVICPVQSLLKKYSDLQNTQITL